jgi:hypothetical protein
MGATFRIVELHGCHVSLYDFTWAFGGDGAIEVVKVAAVGRVNN